MDLPEIRAKVAEYLEKSQLAVASTVCKSWRNSFAPVLYSEIRLDDDTSVPDCDTILKYAKHVRVIKSKGEISALPLEAFSQLQVLHMGLNEDDSDDDSEDESDDDCDDEDDTPRTWDQLVKVFRQNQGLTEISMTADCKIPTNVIESIMSLPTLRRLKFMSCRLGRKSTELLLNASHLECLTLHETEFAELDSFQSWRPSTTMKALVFADTSLGSEQQLEWIKNYPQLQSLTCEVDKELSCATFCKILTNDCVIVENLFVYGEQTDENVAKIIDSTSRLRSFRILGTDFGARSLNSCSRYFQTLTCIDLRHCPTLTSNLSQEIMTSCPRLKEFRGFILEARDILGIREGSELTGQTTGYDSQDWVCLDLEIFSIFICGLDDKPPEWQRRVLQKLARLENLRNLDISRHYENWEAKEDGLNLRLDAGLDILKSLKRLEIFDFSGLCPPMEEAEIHWVLNAWPMLRRVNGDLHSDFILRGSRRGELDKILKEKSIILGNIEENLPW
ncbi:hypothetical protein BGZ79_001484 [Entomortierella chlamydospora]|nr:hypothetical protein BGZ79_001484 [Entomortierella chlamydospora]